MAKLAVDVQALAGVNFLATQTIAFVSISSDE